MQVAAVARYHHRIWARPGMLCCCIQFGSVASPWMPWCLCA